MKTSEKIAYIKGLADGFALDETKPENKIIKQMLDVLEELAAAHNALVEENIKLRDYAEELDADLGDLEEFVYDLDGDEECELCDDDDDGEYEYETFDGEDEEDDEQ